MSQSNPPSESSKSRNTNASAPAEPPRHRGSFHQMYENMMDHMNQFQNEFDRMYREYDFDFNRPFSSFGALPAPRPESERDSAWRWPSLMPRRWWSSALEDVPSSSSDRNWPRYDSMVPYEGGILSRRPFFGNRFQACVPNIDMQDRDSDILVHADMPGMRKEDVKVDVGKGKLTIHGGTTREEKHDTEDFFLKERCQNQFYRSFALPENVKQDETRANFRNGVLEVIIPKTDEGGNKKQSIRID